MTVKKYFGWLGRDAERRAYDKIRDYDIVMSEVDPNHKPTFIDFSQWVEEEQDITLPDIDWQFEFDEGFDFYEAVERGVGNQIPPGPQLVGNCVPYGSCLSLCDRYAVELLEFGENETFWYPFIPYSYGAGRVYVGGVHWAGDGSTGAWQIEADKKHGILPSDLEGIPNSGPTDMQSTRSVNDKWKRTDSILNQWKPEAIEYAVGASTHIRNFEQTKIAICDKKQSVTIASSWGFAPAGNKDGMVIHRRSGSWSHQMHIRGCFAVNNNWYIHVQNQWGNSAHPTIGRKLPPGGFVITAELYDTWAGQAEVYSRGSIKGRIYKPNFQPW